MLIHNDNRLSDERILELALALNKATVTIGNLETQNAELTAENAALKEQLRLLQSKQFGKSSEQSKAPEAEESLPLLTEVFGYKGANRNKKPRGKTTDLSHLPVFQIIHDLP